jgi:hypothetical protein
MNTGVLTQGKQVNFFGNGLFFLVLQHFCGVCPYYWPVFGAKVDDYYLLKNVDPLFDPKTFFRGTPSAASEQG